MKIAWVLYGDLKQKTGGTIYDRMVVEGLQRMGDEVQIVSIAPGASDLASVIRASACEIVVGDELCFRELAVLFRELGRGRPHLEGESLLAVGGQFGHFFHHGQLDGLGHHLEHAL